MTRNNTSTLFTNKVSYSKGIYSSPSFIYFIPNIRICTNYTFSIIYIHTVYIIYTYIPLHEGIPVTKFSISTYSSYWYPNFVQQTGLISNTKSFRTKPAVGMGVRVMSLSSLVQDLSNMEENRNYIFQSKRRGREQIIFVTMVIFWDTRSGLKRRVNDMWSPTCYVQHHWGIFLIYF